MVDEVKYLNGIRLLLSKKGHHEIAKALEGAKCSVNVGNSYSRKRWDCKYTTVKFYVDWVYFDDFTEAVKKVLLEVADIVMPKDESLDVMEIEVSPNLDNIPDHTTQVEMMINGRRYVPVFGQPSTDTGFQCDIFMLMPFRQEFEPVYRKVVIPTVEGLGLTIKRGDDPFSRHEIMHDIWSMLNACKLIIADCTGLNPNVFYELGIAHTIGKPVIMLTQDVKQLPFDVLKWRAIEYNTAFHEIDNLKDSLQRAIRNMLQYDDNLDEIPF